MRKWVGVFLTVWLGFSAGVQASTQGEEVLNLLQFEQLAQQCAPQVHWETLQAIARVESDFNPYAIGVVDGLVQQPQSLIEAIAVAKQLEVEGKNFSLGLVQINKKNLAKLGLSYDTVFDPCVNLKAGADILAECYSRAKGSSQVALHKALSCYYSGNFRTGFIEDIPGLPPYVERVKAAARKNKAQQESVVNVPAIEVAVDTGVQRGAVPKANRSRPLSDWDAFGDW